jgi:hypothetical protein
MAAVAGAREASAHAEAAQKALQMTQRRYCWHQQRGASDRDRRHAQNTSSPES